MTLTHPLPTTSPTRPVPDASAAVTRTPVTVPGTPAAVTAAARTAPATRPAATGKGSRAANVFTIIGTAVLAGIGFTGSYKALRDLGLDRDWGTFAYVFPIGVDAGIVVLYALDLFLIRRHTPWPMLRTLAHLLTAATIAFNTASGDKSITADPIGAGMHAVIPIMFVAAVEAVRRLIMKAADIEAGRDSQGVPVYRWVLAPVRTWALFRQMKLWGLTSYGEAVARQQALTVYRVMLERQHGSVRKAPSDACLPLTMARFGLTVDEALELPQQAREDERLRKDAEAAREVAAQQRAEERAAALRIAAIRTEGHVKAAEFEVEGETGAAQAQAQAARIEAEAVAEAQARAAAQEAQALESVAAAEAQERAAVTREAAAVTERAAAAAEEAAAGTRARAAAVNRRAAEDEARIEVAQKSTAEARADAAEADKRAAAARAHVAEMEVRAVAMEDEAKLSPRERAARKVARMILTSPDRTADDVDLATIADALGVSPSTASDYRRAAADLIFAGYQLP